MAAYWSLSSSLRLRIVLSQDFFSDGVKRIVTGICVCLSVQCFRRKGWGASCSQYSSSRLSFFSEGKKRAEYVSGAWSFQYTTPGKGYLLWLFMGINNWKETHNLEILRKNGGIIHIHRKGLRGSQILRWIVSLLNLVHKNQGRWLDLFFHFATRSQRQIFWKQQKKKSNSCTRRLYKICKISQ